MAIFFVLGKSLILASNWFQFNLMLSLRYRMMRLTSNRFFSQSSSLSTKIKETIQIVQKELLLMSIFHHQQRAYHKSVSK